MKKVIITVAAAAALIFTGTGAQTTEAASVNKEYKSICIQNATNQEMQKLIEQYFAKTTKTFSPEQFKVLVHQFNVSPEETITKVMKKVKAQEQTVKAEEPSVKAPVKEEVKAPVKEEAKAPVKEEVKAPVKEEVKAPVKEEAKAPVKEEVKAPVKEEVKAPVKEETPETTTTQEPAKQETTKEEAAPKEAVNSEISAFEKEVVALTNAERSKQGLKALEMDTELSKVAGIKSQDMKDKNYFDHTSPTYGSPFDMMKSFGINYSAAGENIAMGQTTPQQVVTSWMNSEGHRANILSANFTHIGVGHVESGNYWTQMFIGK
ncbi:CAP domain-containing protein [Peribacillus sp. FSL H8-0477]|uniref:CAP domain-containing protein n=1 Tax=Peribacillus sp. FSL H8-0477 TaxID=2921388 RepID=UPI0030FB2DFE